MRVAVCDRIKADGEALKELLTGCWRGVPVEVFESGQEVLAQARMGRLFELIFLNVEEPGQEELETGAILRDRFPGTELVLVSSSPAFGPEAFELGALHYLMKPCTQEKIREVRARYLKNRERRSIITIRKGKLQEIPYHLITYVESSHNDLLIHLATGSVLKTRGSLHEMMEKTEGRFLRVNRRYMVNMEAVERMSGDTCEAAGVTFTLSRRERAKNKKQFNEWQFRTATGRQDR